jgi:hypothetical protein
MMLSVRVNHIECRMKHGYDCVQPFPLLVKTVLLLLLLLLLPQSEWLQVPPSYLPLWRHLGSMMLSVRVNHIECRMKHGYDCVQPFPLLVKTVLLLLLLLLPQSEWLQVPPSYLPLWRHLGFSPASPAKTLAYAVLAPSGSAAVVTAFMRVSFFTAIERWQTLAEMQDCCCGGASYQFSTTPDVPEIAVYSMLSSNCE